MREEEGGVVEDVVWYIGGEVGYVVGGGVDGERVWDVGLEVVGLVVIGVVEVGGGGCGGVGWGGWG